MWLNYNTLDFKIFTQCENCWERGYCKFGGDTCIGLEDIARKREGGGARNSPPSGARVNDTFKSNVRYEKSCSLLRRHVTGKDDLCFRVIDPASVVSG